MDWYSHFHEEGFKESVSRALTVVQRILDVNRNPRLASDVDHQYIDKYALADMLTNTAIIAQMNVLERLGLGKDALKAIDKSKPVTLRFAASDSCSLLKEQTVDVRHPSAAETIENTDTTGFTIGSTKKSTISTIVTRVKEHHWEVKADWEISVYAGTDLKSRMILESRSSSTIVVVQSENAKPPLGWHTDRRPVEVSLTWLLNQIDTENLTSQFHIDTHDDKTKTPVRNTYVEAALEFTWLLDGWANEVRRYFIDVMQRQAIDKHNPVKPSIVEANQPKSLVELTADGIFIPVLPLMGEETHTEDVSPTPSKSVLGFQLPIISGDANARDTSPVLSCKDALCFLDEQVRTLEETQKSITKAFPGRQLLKLVSVAEASLCILCLHSLDISRKYRQSMNFVESMLENQLVAAIGKRVSSSDLDQFVKYHNARFLTPAPRPFCHSIRRPKHFPEGILSIESTASDGKMEPIETHVREVDSTSGLTLALNSATTVELTGKKFLHGWLNHCFQDTWKSHQLISRARQFSSFMLVVGTMVGHDRIQPKDAIVIRDKDEVNIPLLLNEIPSAKEFKDAIGSLSPEQQRFAKTYRSMQLGASVLGVCVIQIKPQLEELLGLPHDALTKEMKLTQDLMGLFVDYQVPSDLLSYDGEYEATTSDKIKNVKGHVKSVLDVITGTKLKQLQDQVLQTDMAVEKDVVGSEGYIPGPHPTRPTRPRSSESRADVTSGPRPPTFRGVGPFGLPQGNQMGFMKTQSSVCENQPEGSSMAFQTRPVASAARAFAASGPDAQRSRVLREQDSAGSSGLDDAAFSFLGLKSKKIDACEDENLDLRDNALDLRPGSENEPEWSQKLEAEAKSTVGQKGDGNKSLDFTIIPKMLDSIIEKHDKDGALRSTTIKTSDCWTRSRQENLLTKSETQTLGSDDIKSEKEKAYDLLDALSRSGSLPISYSELHVIICVTHRFENDVMGTVIKNNINPIEKLEMSTLLVASTILGVSANQLIRSDGDRVRLSTSIPALLVAPPGET